ncbi:hypothetical protein [Tsukamurella paurometabola]|uniref:Uncharacterized protein n=1 Tax=Tsukamurella paurometabola TaxID=2061 RepID=A0ABS5NEJ1_TSUPA|nr:hypothetical protein [Tsukamurella paurometabola]MBS4102445.1 hypothetical protein [Tsukamurella paurometabola]
MTWHYVAAKGTYKGEVIYTIQENFPDYGHSINPMGMSPSGGTLKELKRDPKHMLKDLERFPVLDLGEMSSEG